MEILKFDESGTSSPSRKRSGRGAILVTFVALVFGAGTALASGTLTVNGPSNEIQLAQAVATTAQCDDDVTIGLETTLSGTAFNLSKVKVSNINTSNCEDKYIKIKVYDDVSGTTDVAFCTSSGISADSGCFDSGKAYVKQIGTLSSIDFSISSPFLVIASDTTVGRVTVEITDTDPSA